jgi:hypothetical protein
MIVAALYIERRHDAEFEAKLKEMEQNDHH